MDYIDAQKIAEAIQNVADAIRDHTAFLREREVIVSKESKELQNAVNEILNTQILGKKQ